MRSSADSSEALVKTRSRPAPGRNRLSERPGARPISTSWVQLVATVHHCIGNSGPLPEPIAAAIARAISPSARCSRVTQFRGPRQSLTAPIILLRHAGAGSALPARLTSICEGAAGQDKKGSRSFWPTLAQQSRDLPNVNRFVKPSSFRKRYADVFAGDRHGARSHLRAVSPINDGHFDLRPQSAHFTQMPAQLRRSPRSRARGSWRSWRQHHHDTSRRRLDQEDGPADSISPPMACPMKIQL